MKNKIAKIALLLIVVVSSYPYYFANAERTTTYFHTDALGSVVAATDENGDVLWRKHYQPFGAQLEGSDSSEDVSYTGKQYDQQTGLSYYGARYYDPQIGRFTSIDPVGALEAIEINPMMFNRYAYANNNPYKFVDPDGRAANFAWGAAIGFAVEGAFQIYTGEFDGGKLFTATVVGAVTSGGSAIIAAKGTRTAVKIASTAGLGGTANTAGTVGLNLYNGEETSSTDVGASFLAGALGASVGARSVKSPSGLSTSSVIRDHLVETTANVGKDSIKTASGRAARRAAIGTVGLNIVKDSLVESGSKVLDNQISELDD